MAPTAGQTRWSTNFSSWRRLRHSNVPSQCVPYSPTIGVICLVYFLVYIQFDAYVIQPRVMARQVNVPGALVVVAALAGGTLLGIVGALLAVPTMAVLLVLYREIAVPHLEAT